MSFRERARKISRLAFHQLERAWAFGDRSWRRAGIVLSGADSARREASHWSAPKPGLILTWQDHPWIRRHINRRVSGDPEINWLEFFHRDFGKAAFERALNLGSGFGDLEAHAFTLRLARHFHSIDISERAVAAARERLRGRPITFEVADLNDYRFSPAAYDVAFAASSLHHFHRLPEVLDQVERALRPGGYLVLDEYVGPSRFQWRPDQLEMVNELLAALPARYRRDLRGWGRKRRVYRPALDETNRNSPFEAARSEEILPLLQARFDLVARRDYGGAILHPLLDGIAGNFLPECADDNELLSRLAALEAKLERAGRIASDFTVVVARKG